MRKNIKDIQKNDTFHAIRNGKEYHGVVVKVSVHNRETMITFGFYEQEGGEKFRNLYPCDCDEWTAEQPELV